ncbi:MAG: aminodeoxychorismate synthase component I [Acidobacteria bacterium]|nr:MAG: aminodeoxychorismate synthase component I [Acidobacteriota bacterium]
MRIFFPVWGGTGGSSSSTSTRGRDRSGPSPRDGRASALSDPLVMSLRSRWPRRAGGATRPAGDSALAPIMHRPMPRALRTRVAAAPRKEILDRFAGLERLPLPFLLETAGAAPGRVLMGASPFAVLEARQGRVRLWSRGAASEVELPPLEALRRLLLDCAARGHREALLVGFFGYDLAWELERLPPQRAVRDQDFPDLLFAAYDRWIRWIPVERRFVEVRAGRPQPPALDRSGEMAAFGGPPPALPERNFDRRRYLAAVEEVRRLIARGEIYQANLSQRFAARWDAPPLELYRRLRAVSPAPYAAYLRFGERAVISSSPELFLEVRGSSVRTRPIKGTRPRGHTSEEDARLQRELLGSAKDAAELTMIVDLERNDLGRVCEPGSVRVTRLRELEKHPHVLHLVATVEGRLARGRDALDLVEAAFPGGSVTGAPKLRAMAVLDELEPTRRALFTGAIGYLTPAGEMVTSIAIRTILWQGGVATFQVGGGIVWDSRPEAEYEETLVKSRGMAAALGLELR